MSILPIESDGFIFEFPDALSAYIFDEKDPTKPTYHDAPMKAVDIVAEFDNAYVFIEMKDYFDEQDKYNIKSFATEEELKDKKKAFQWLKNYLKYKFRDTYLFRHAEGKVEKKIHYLCLLTLSKGVNSILAKELRDELPVGKKSIHWQRELAATCKVLDLDTWNKCFPKWPVRRISGSVTTP